MVKVVKKSYCIAVANGSDIMNSVDGAANSAGIVQTVTAVTYTSVLHVVSAVCVLNVVSIVAVPDVVTVVAVLNVVSAVTVLNVVSIVAVLNVFAVVSPLDVASVVAALDVVAVGLHFVPAVAAVVVAVTHVGRLDANVVAAFGLRQRALGSGAVAFI